MVTLTSSCKFVFPFDVLVNRLIKYTGMGNAAGLLYDFGLLNNQHSGNAEQYSSDSDESDTEVYKKIRDDYE